MTTSPPPDPPAALRAALQDASSSARLRSALRAGTDPHPAFVAILLERCAEEPDFFVRDMLTWALVRHPAAQTVPRLLDEVRGGTPQARSQALHTLSKIADPRSWPAITPALLRDPDEEVARSAWRAAVSLVPGDQQADLAAQLCTQLGRGDGDLQRSLSRALATLGEAASPALHEHAAHVDANVRVHALATHRLMHDPEEGFEAAVFEARRFVALTGSPSSGVDP